MAVSQLHGFEHILLMYSPAVVLQYPEHPIQEPSRLGLELPWI